MTMTQNLLAATEATQPPTADNGPLDFSFLDETAAEVAPALSASSLPQGAAPQARAAHTSTPLPAAQDKADALDFSFLDEAPPAQPDSVDEAERAAYSLNHASRYTRQQVQEARNNARILGITFEEALAHGVSASELARQASAEDLRKFSPRLVQALQNKAAYAERDDLPHMEGIATAFDGVSLSDADMDAALAAPRANGRISQRMQEGAQQMGDALRGSMVGILEGYLADTRREAETNTKFYGFDYESDPLYSGVKGMVDRWKASVQAGAAHRVAALPPAETVLGRYTESVAQMAPQIVGQIVSFAMGGPVLSGGFMASQIFGGTYNDLTDKGVDADRAVYAALGSTLAQTPLEMLSFNKALAVFKTSGTWNTAKALLGSAFTEGVTEFLQSYPAAVAEIWATTSQQGGSFEQGLKEFADRLGEITLEGLYEGAVAAPYGALFGGLGMARNGKATAESIPGLLDQLPSEVREALAAESRHAMPLQERQRLGEALERAAAHIDASKTTAQDRETMREVVEELLPEDLRTAWMGAEDAYTLYQGAVERDASGATPGTEAQDFLSALGTDKESLHAAVAQGLPLQVPASSALTLFRGDVRAQVLDALRPTPDGVSGAEAKAYDPQARMDAVMEAVRSSQKIRSEVKREGTRIAKEIHDIKAADGTRIYPAHVAEAYATLNTQQALALQASYGSDPVADLLARRNFALANTSMPPADMAVDAHMLAQSAMFRNKAATLADFVQLAQQEKGDGNKSYYGLGHLQRPEAEGEIILAADAVKHISGRHPDFAEWSKITEVMQHGDVHPGRSNAPLQANTLVFVKEEGGVAHVVIGAQLDGKKLGKRIQIVTTFKDTIKNVRNYLENNNAAFYQSAGGSPAYPSPYAGDAISALESGVSDENISKTGKNVNEGDAQSDASTPRGYTTLTPQSAAVRIFQNADLSTIPHESMHIFLDDLMRVAADDGSIALAEMQRRVESALQGRGIDAHSAATVREMMGEALAAAPGQRLAALHSLREGAKRMSHDARQTAQNAEAAAKSMQQQHEQGGQPLNPAALPPWAELSTAAFNAREDARAATTVANAASIAISHMYGLEKARNDLRILRRFAKVAEEGDLSRDDWRTLHETTASAFEVYLTEGKAPSAELKDTFSRIRQWLLNLWKECKEKFPALQLNDDVRRVFDRMLTTDRQLLQSREMGDVLRAEDTFLESGQLSHDEWSALTDLRNQAEAEVQAAMDSATLRDRKKRRADHLKAAYAALADDPFWQAVDNLSARVKDAADPTAPTRGGINRESVVRLIGEAQTAELARRRPGLINGKGNGLPADIAAMEYAHALGIAEDEDAFITMLYDRLVAQGESRRTLASRMADSAMEEEDANAAAVGMAAGAEAYAAYLDRVDEVVLRRMAAQKYRSEREQLRFVQNSIVPRVRIQQMAADEIMNTPLRDITPARYQAMLDKALKDRAKAVLAGEVVKALDAVERARIANELRGRAVDILARRDATLSLAGRLASAKPGAMPTVQRESLRKVLARYNLGRVSGTGDAALQGASLADLVRQICGDSADGVLPSFPAWVLDGTHPDTGEVVSGVLSYTQLTPTQLQHVHDMLKFLQKSAFDQRTDNAQAEAARLNAVVRATSDAMAGLEDMQQAEAGSLRRTLQKSLRGIYGATDALRWQMRKADGLANVLGKADSTKGAAETALLDPALKGEQRARGRLGDINAQMAPHLVQLAQSVKAWEKQYGKNLLIKDKNGKPVVLPLDVQKAYGRKHWTADMVIALALNVGNDSNMRRINSFYTDLDHDTVAALLGDAVADRIFRTRTVVDAHAPQGLLSLRDWQAIQGIWDALASQWEDTQAVHERMFGFKPQGVDALPMVLVDNHTGEHVSLRGGYYPVRYDPNISERVANWGEMDDILARNDSMFAVPSAKRGHTKAREERTPSLPIRLDTGVIMEHVNDVVRYIELGEIARFADKVTRHSVFAAQYKRVYGKEDYDAIRPNLRGLVRAEPPPKNEIVKLANKMRKYLVPWGLAWNFKVAALQLTAVFPAMGDIGAQHVMRGMAWLGKNGMQGMRSIWQASPYMQSRMENIDQDLQRHVANFNPSKRPASVTVAGREFAWESVVEAGMLPIVAVDALATGSVWLGAYSQKLAQLEGSSPGAAIQAGSPHHQQAVDYADSVVKQGNPDFDPSSRSGFLRANDTYRIFNNFASAVTLFAQRHRYMYTAHSKGKVTLAQLARFEAYDTVLPATAVFLLLALARGYFSEDDDDDKGLLKLFMSTAFDFASMRLPIFGGVLGDAALSLTHMGDGGGAGGRGGIRTALDAPVDFVGNLSGRAGKAIWQEGDISDDQAKRLVYGAGDIASFILRVPISKKIRDAERGYDQWQRGEGTPASIIMPRPGK